MAVIRRTGSALMRRARRLVEPIPGGVFSLGAAAAQRPSIVYVTDGAGWVLDEVGSQIARHLTARCRMTITTTYRGYRRCLIHFSTPPVCFSRQAYLHVHPSNQQVLTWTHGLPDNPDPHIQGRIASLQEGERYLSRIKVPTHTARDFLLVQGIDPAKLVHIPFGVDPRVFAFTSPADRRAARARLGVPEGAFCIGSFQKDSPGFNHLNRQPKWVKGPDILVRTIGQIAAHRKVFVLLSGPARGYVMARLEEEGIPYRHAWVDAPADLAGYYQALDVYLITSRDEGGPMAFLEAMACGVPVISTAMGMPRDLIRHGVNGMLAPVDDVERLVDAALSLAEDPELMASIARAGRETAESHDWSVIADKYAAMLYNLPPVEDGSL